MPGAKKVLDVPEDQRTARDALREALQYPLRLNLFFPRDCARL